MNKINIIEMLQHSEDKLLAFLEGNERFQDFFKSEFPHLSYGTFKIYIRAALQDSYMAEIDKGETK